MDAIGGYFGLADREEGVFPHKGGILLNTGRNALEYILRSIGNVKRVYLPYYTCEVVLEPLKKLNIPWTYYHTDSKFEISDPVDPKEGEYIIANNYFGIKDAYIKTLADKYGERLIVDCAQSLFAKPLDGIKAFYSTRKFVGVADGGVAYLGTESDGKMQVTEYDCTTSHDSHLIKRKELGAEAGFADYQENERKLDNQLIRWMSDKTKDILEHIDFDKVKARRRDNYRILSEALKERNILSLPALDTFSCPMVYPFMAGTDSVIRKKLIQNRVYVAKYWPNVTKTADYESESSMADGVIPLPCDQRYGETEMRQIIELITR